MRYLEPMLAGQAAALARKASASLARRESELEGDSRRTSKLLLRMSWWEARLRGLRDLVCEVEVCGESDRVLRCSDCGHAWRVPRRCDQPLLCEQCEGRQLRQRRARLYEQIEAAHRDLPHGRRRFLTLTVPGVGTTADRVRWAVLGRPRLFAALGRELGERWHWWARFEATGGTDGRGHCHWHAVSVGPFLPDPLIAALWGRTLERLRCPVLQRPLGAALERLRDLGRSCRIGIGRWNRRLIELARVPWTVTGRECRRRRYESPAAWIVRRAEWAACYPEARTCTGEQLAGRLPDAVDELLGAPILLARLGQVAHLAHAVVDVRVSRARADVRELCKYAIKRWAVEPELYASLVYELHSRRARTFQSSAGDGCQPSAAKGCPECGSPNVRPERDEPKAWGGERMARLGFWLSGQIPPEFLLLREA